MSKPSVLDLYAALCPDLPVYVLIDPLLGEPLPLRDLESIELPEIERAREVAWTRKTQRIVLSFSIVLPAHLHPYLVLMRGPKDEWLSDTLDIAMRELNESREGGLAGSGTAVHRIGGWLQSSRDPAQFAQELAILFLAINHPQNLQYLRLPDRRVFAWIRELIPENNLKAMLKPIARWAYLNPWGALVAVGSERASGPRPLPLHAFHWAQMTQCELHHRTLALWLGQSALSKAQNLADQPIAGDWGPVTRAIELATGDALQPRLALATVDDQIALAALILLHPALEQQDKRRTLLNSLPSSLSRRFQSFAAELHIRLSEEQP